MKLPIKIDLNGGVGSVEVAGQDIASEVMAVRASIDPRDGTRVTLEMRPGALHLADEQTLVGVDDRTAAALEALGWTPPADDGTTVTVTETTTITETTETTEYEHVLTWHPLEGDPVEIPLYEHVELPAGIGELRSHTRELPVADGFTDVAAGVVVDFLGLVGVGVTVEQVGGWTREQREQAARWAGACHLSASDNDVEVPPRPDFLDREATGGESCPS